jgi:ADP-heptose:LPS heptosyltransferase
MKILIFRADRVGDFILTSILINSIKKKFNNAEIHIVASLKNYNFIKNSTLVNKVHLLPKKTLFKIINF